MPSGSARIGPICSIPGLLAEFGVDAAEILSELGLAPDLFADPERVMAYADGGRLFAACAARTACPHFGLLVGQRCSLAGLGLVGNVAQVERDVGSALWRIVRYLPLFDRGSVLALRVADEDASLIFGILAGSILGIDQFYDLAIAIAFNTVRDLCGSCWRPSLVTLPHKAPADVRPYRAAFGTNVRFDEAEAAIVFDRFYLGRPLAASTAAERMRLLNRAAKIESMLDMSFVERVRRQLRSSLPTHWLTEDQVAEQLMVSARVLRLRLAEAGSSFRAIVDELRYETARQYLTTSTLEFNDVALLLGYSEASAFSRAFRRWAGAAPSDWRAKLSTDLDRPPANAPATASPGQA
ncbi:MAG TPA: AraC family transcriptional regulator [Roseiarcus sp.]